MFDDLFSSFKEEPWNYMYTVHYKKLKSNTFATDGHDLFMYDTDLGRYIPADDKLRNVFANSMKHERTAAHSTASTLSAHTDSTTQYGRSSESKRATRTDAGCSEASNSSPSKGRRGSLP